jgi:hypothetical protein
LDKRLLNPHAALRACPRRLVEGLLHAHSGLGTYPWLLTKLLLIELWHSRGRPSPIQAKPNLPMKDDVFFSNICLFLRSRLNPRTSINAPVNLHKSATISVGYYELIMTKYTAILDTTGTPGCRAVGGSS